MTLPEHDTGSPSAPPRPARESNPGRSLSLLGFLLLVVCFFLPQVRGCSEDIVPVRETVRSGPIWLFCFALPFVFGWLGLLVYGLRFLARIPRHQRRLIIAWCATCLVLIGGATGLLYPLLIDWARDVHFEHVGWDLVVAIEGLVGGLLVAAAAWAVFRGPWPLKLPAVTFCCSIGSLIYFAHMTAILSSLYGIWLSMAACALIAAGSVWELATARQLSRLPPGLM